MAKIRLVEWCVRIGGNYIKMQEVWKDITGKEEEHKQKATSGGMCNETKKRTMDTQGY